jgi:hypothetical protein
MLCRFHQGHSPAERERKLGFPRHEAKQLGEQMHAIARMPAVAMNIDNRRCLTASRDRRAPGGDEQHV